MLRRIIIPLAKGLTKILFKVKVLGAEKLPDGGYIIAANHLSFWDPVFIGAYLSKKKITFLAKDELFKFKPFGAFISALGAVPVSRRRMQLPMRTPANRRVVPLALSASETPNSRTCSLSPL